MYRDSDRRQPNIDPGTLNREPSDPKISDAIDKLNQDVRFLSDPKNFSHLENNVYDLNHVSYESPDGKKAVILWGSYLRRNPSLLSNMPASLGDDESCIPFTYTLRVDKGNNPNLVSWKTESLWISLNEKKPKIFQLLKENGVTVPLIFFDSKFVTNGIPGDVKVEDHPEYLPDFLDAMSGNRSVKL